MTKRGHFIINGAPRVIVNQIIRAPGVYYQQQLNKTLQKGQKQFYRTFFVDIISRRGVWIRFELDKKRQIWVRMKKTPKIPIFLFLKSLGFSLKNIFSDLKSSTTNFLDPGWLRPQNFLFYMTKNFQIEKQINSDYLELISKKFLNSQHYDLGQVGRRRLNNKLGLKTIRTVLTPLDFLKITYCLLNLTEYQGEMDDIDHLSHRRIRTVGELLEIQFFQAFIRLEKMLDEKMKKMNNLESLFTPKPLNTSIREFFGSCQLSQFLDQTNPLAELTHKRRISCLGPNGIQRETAGMDIRGIHATYFGRICPIETPEGQNAGLVNSLTIFSIKNAYGFLTSLFYKIYKGQLQKQSSLCSLTADAEQNYKVNFGDLQCSSLSFLNNNIIPARYQLNLIRSNKNHLQLGIFSPFQMISIATSLIPFLEHNDANRVLMGSNMQRQAVPLLVSQFSHIRNHSESRVISDTGYGIQSDDAALALYVSKNQLDLYQPRSAYISWSSINGFQRTPWTHKQSFLYEQIHKSLLYLSIDKNSKKILLDRMLSRSRSKKMNVQVLFHPNQVGVHLSKIVYKVGRNDALKFDKKIFQNIVRLRKIYGLLFYKKNRSMEAPRVGHSRNNLISLEQLNVPIEKYKIKQIDSLNLQSIEHFSIQKAKFNRQKKTIWLKNFQKTNQGTYLIQKPLINTLEWVQKADLLTDGSTSLNGQLALGQNLLIAYLPWEGFNFEDAIIINEQLILQEKYTSLHIEKYELEVRETFYGLERITPHLPIQDDSLNQLDKNGIIRCGCLVKEGTILVGKVTPIENKPLLPHEKLLYDIVGKTIERIKDTSLRAPKNTSGRVIYISMNDQPYQTFKYKHLNCQKIGIYIAEKRKIQIGDKMAGRYGNKGIISKILPIQDLPFLLNGEIIDLILNPLGVPSRMNVGQLFECLLGLASKNLHQDFQLEIFDEKYGFDASRSLVYSKLFELRKKYKQKWFFSTQSTGKIPLFDGRTGEKYQQLTTVGQSYIMKLIHLVDDKMHARSTGPYSLVTQQPLKGRSKHGGQRFGEMEVWALEGFGSAFILQELLTVKSDDTQGRTKIIENILTNSTMKFGTPESFKVLLKELQSLCLDITICQTMI